MTRRLLLICAFGGILGGCDGTIRRVDATPPPPPGRGGLQLLCNVSDAELYVDSRYFGQLKGYREGRLALPLGQRRIELRSPGYYTTYVLTEISAANQRIEVLLVAIPDFDGELPASKKRPRRLN